MIRLPSVIIAVWLLASVAYAQLIDFENLPGTTTLPADNTSLTSSYPLDTGSVRFFFLDSAGTEVAPIFEARDDEDSDPQGFASSRHGGSDHGGTNYGPILGNRFLRQPDGIGVLPGSFVLDYDVSQPIDALSGEIWDIDAGDLGYEKWQVDVLDKDGILVRPPLISPTGINGSNPASLDSRPWVFSFANLTRCPPPSTKSKSRSKERKPMVLVCRSTTSTHPGPFSKVTITIMVSSMRRTIRYGAVTQVRTLFSKTKTQKPVHRGRSMLRTIRFGEVILATPEPQLRSPSMRHLLFPSRRLCY